LIWLKINPPRKKVALAERKNNERAYLALLFLQASEQYFTSSQTLSHFLRHEKGRWQTMHSLLGKSPFFRMRLMAFACLRYAY
jgi:hypothetical protein